MRRRHQERKFKAKGSIAFLLLLIAIVAIIGRLWGIQEMKSKEADYFREKYEESITKSDYLIRENGRLQEENKELKSKAPTAALPDATFKSLVQMLFPTKESQDRYIKIVTTCENGTRDPFRTNVNKDGTTDVGVSQINDRWHAQRVENMFGEPFYKAMTDSVKNMVYAAWLYKNDGNFHQWACDKII